MADDTPAYEECQMLDFGCHLSSFGNMLGDFFGWIYQQVVDAGLYALGLIPVPDWMATPSFTLPDGVLWFADVLQMQEGIAIMTSASVIRFIIRRLPFVG